VNGEVKELKTAIEAYIADPTLERTPNTEKLPRNVALEAADVANFAMMIANVVGGLRNSPFHEMKGT
jgi:hypothetical protein